MTAVALCRLAEIPDGGSRGLALAPGGSARLVGVRRGERVFLFVNACPHLGTPLDIVPDRFLSADGAHIVCATHGALFAVETGVCLAGPSVGLSLEPVPVRIEAGVVWVEEARDRGAANRPALLRPAPFG